MDKRANNALQNITKETIDRAAQIALKTKSRLRGSGSVRNFSSTRDIRRVTVK
jgi:hypothetical protein